MYVWVDFMKEKFEMLKKFKFKENIESIIDGKIKCLRMDNGREYTSKKVFSYLRACKIRCQLTYSRTLQQNGMTEKKIDILEKHVKTCYM